MPKPRLSKSQPLQPYWQTLDEESIKLYQGDVVKVLSQMPEKSVQMVVTSPPYWALRSYLPDVVKIREDLSEEDRVYVESALTERGILPTDAK